MKIEMERNMDITRKVIRGLSYATVAKEYNIHPTRVKQIAVKMLKMAYMGKRHITWEVKIEEIRWDKEHWLRVLNNFERRLN